VVVAADPSLLPYNLPETFERWVVYYACSSAQFWALAGKELIPSLMQRPEAQLLIKAVQEMAQVEDGHPSNRHLVIQRLHSWSLEGGRLKLAECAAADAYLSDMDEDAIPPQEKVVEELAQTLRRQMLMQASNAIPGAFVAGPDAEKARKLAMDRLEAAGSVGKGDTSMGRSLDVGVLGEISALKRIPKIAVGIPEVDNILAGGVRYGENMFFLGDSSGGKSTALVHFACSALRQGCFVLYATLELARQYVMMRVVGNLTYTVLADIEYGRQPGYAEAGRRLDWLIAHHRIGRFVCKFHKKGKTALKDIRAWVGEEERRAGRKADLVVIDADEHVNHVDDDGSEYRGLGILYERMVDWAEGPDPDVDHDSKCVIATASQAKGRSGEGDRILTHADTADSQRKHRNSYVCITINNRGERRSEVILNVSKNRNGDTGLTTTLPTNFAMGQLVVVNDAYPWIAQKKKWDAMRQMDLS